MNCSPPGFSVHKVSQAKILEWIAISFSRESTLPKNWTLDSYIAGGVFTNRATRKALEIINSISSSFLSFFFFFTCDLPSGITFLLLKNTLYKFYLSFACGKSLSLYCLKCVSFALTLIAIFPECGILSWLLFSFSTLKACFHCFVASFVITKKSAQFLSFFKGHLSVHSGPFLSPQFHCYTLRCEFFPNELLWY